MSNPGYSGTLDQTRVPEARPGRIVVGVLFMLYALAGCMFFERGSPLIDPLPAISLIWAFSVGVLIGLLLTYFSPLPLKPRVYLTLPVVCGLLAIPNLEAAVEIYAFHNLVPQTTQSLARINGTFSSGFKRLSCAGVKVQAYPGARSVPIRTDRSICSGVSDLYWEHSPKCFLIDVETGRNGIKRASAPANQDRRRSCPGA